MVIDAEHRFKKWFGSQWYFIINESLLLTVFNYCSCSTITFFIWYAYFIFRVSCNYFTTKQNLIVQNLLISNRPQRQATQLENVSYSKVKLSLKICYTKSKKKKKHILQHESGDVYNKTSVIQDMTLNKLVLVKYGA